MTTWNDEELMAHADGELTGERRGALDRALQHDAGLRERLARLKAQRQRIAAAFGDVMDEPVPERLSALLRAPIAEPVEEATPPKIVDLAERRQQRDERRGMASWAAWGGMAASFALGVVLGVQLLGSGAAGEGGALVSEAGGRLVAGKRLAEALDTQVAGEAGGVAVQLTFVDRSGHYCRTFSAGETAGIACRQADRWTVDATAKAEQAPTSAMRQAGSPLPRALLDAVDAQIDGAALTADQVKQAQQRGWRR
jgi:hypothetical protein